jgi:putative endonuclease
MEKIHTVYIMAKGRNSTFYTGYSSELLIRSSKHKTGYYPNAFTKKYKIDKLVYYEIHGDEESAKLREKQLKKWNRPWKMRLIEEMNPDWKDLFETLL